MPEAGKDPHGDPEGHDTDEQFADHPELAPSESRISKEKVKGLEAESHRRSLAGEPVEDAGDTHRKVELNFVRNNDIGGNEMALPTGADDYSRGSGFIGGKLVGEGPSGERNPSAEAPGFPSSADQERNIEAIRREETESQGDWSAHPMDVDSEVSQGRDVSRPRQATGTQQFGRDVGSSGLDEEDRDGHGMGPGKTQSPPNHKIWSAILRRLGGSSPGSEENLELARLFQRVQFPTDKEGVSSRLEPGAEFRLKEGIVVDLRQALDHSRAKTFRNLNDLVDVVKDELRRQEADGLKVMKMA